MATCGGPRRAGCYYTRSAQSKPSLTRGRHAPTIPARRVRLLFVNANRSRSFGGVERWMIDAASGLAARVA